jgi:hypothetical protein
LAVAVIVAGGVGLWTTEGVALGSAARGVGVPVAVRVGLGVRVEDGKELGVGVHVGGRVAVETSVSVEAGASLADAGKFLNDETTTAAIAHRTITSSSIIVAKTSFWFLDIGAGSILLNR